MCHIHHHKMKPSQFLYLKCANMSLNPVLPRIMSVRLFVFMLVDISLWNETLRLASCCSFIWRNKQDRLAETCLFKNHNSLIFFNPTSMNVCWI